MNSSAPLSKLHHRALLGPLSFVLLLALASPPMAGAKTADDFLGEARGYLERQDYRAAIIQYKNALKAQPDNIDARLELSKAYFRTGNLKGAEKELLKARDLGAPAGKWMIPLGELYLLQGRASDLLDTVEPSQDMSPVEQADVLALRAEAQTQLGKREAAKALLEQAIELDASNVRALLGLARLDLLEGRIEPAVQRVEKVLEQLPNNLFALSLRAELARQAGDNALALAYFDRALAVQAEYLPALLGSISVLVAQGDGKTALQRIARVRKRQPDNTMANYFEALVHYREKDYKAAEKALQVVFKSTPDQRQAQLLMGAVQFAQGRYEQALDYLSRFHKAVPGLVEGGNLLAATLLKLDQPDRAIEVLQQLERREPDNVRTLSLLGSAYMAKRQPAKATEYLERAAQIDPQRAAYKTQLGLGYLGEGETAQAIDVLKSLPADELDAQSGILLIIAYLRKRDFDQAFETAQTLAGKEPRNPVYRNFMGVVKLAAGDKAEARTYFGQALRIDPGFVPAHMSLARMAQGERDFAEARAHYQAILQHHPDNTRAMLALAQLASLEGDRKAMLDWLLRARKAGPEEVNPGVVLARFYISTGQPLKALETAQDVARRHPDHPQVLEVQGLAQLAAGEKASAVATFRRLVKRAPRSARAHLLLARAQMNNGDLQAARETLQQARRLGPNFGPVYRALADIALREKRYDEALGHAAEAKRQLPAAAVGWEIEGDAHYLQGHYSEAVTAYRQAYGKQASAARVIKLAEAGFRAGQVEQAIAALRQWLVRFPGDFRVRLLLANQLQQVGRNAAAIENYEKLLSQRPDYLPVVNNLAWLYNEQNDAKALRHARRAYELAPENPSVIDTYGWVELHQGDAKKALRLLQQASMKAPHVPEIKYHLAVALQRNGQPEAARLELQQLLRTTPSFKDADKARALLAELTTVEKSKPDALPAE